MTLSFCHVALLTADLGAAAERILNETGLASYDGGRAPGRGGGYRMIPFGESYFEIISIVDEHEARASGLTIGDRLGPDGADVFTGWFLQTGSLRDLHAIARRLGVEPNFGVRARVTPDGERISNWGLIETFHRYLPAWNFSVNYWPDPQRFPGRAYPAPHRVEPVAMSWIEFGGGQEAARLVRDIVGPDGARLDLRFTGDEPGIRAVGVQTTSGEVQIRI